MDKESNITKKSSYIDQIRHQSIMYNATHARIYLSYVLGIIDRASKEGETALWWNKTVRMRKRWAWFNCPLIITLSDNVCSEIASMLKTEGYTVSFFFPYSFMYIRW